MFLEKDCLAFNQQLKNLGTPAKFEPDKTKKSDKELFLPEFDLSIEDSELPDVTLLKDPSR